MDQTTHLLLNKPTDADTFDQGPFNANADIIEAEHTTSPGTFKATKTPVGIVNNTNTTVSPDTEVYDYGNLFDPVTGRYTVTVSGIYLFIVKVVTVTAMAAVGNNLEAQLWKNAALLETHREEASSTAAAIHSRGVFFASLVAGDFIKPGVYQDTGATINVNIDIMGTRLIRT